MKPAPPRMPMHLTLCLLAALLMTAGSACASRRAVPEPPPAAALQAPAVGNTVDEMRQLMDGQQLTELRTTYNGNYGASLLFHATTLDYYVALFHEKEFWRVIKTDSVENAETLYRTFVEQTEELAQVYIDTVRLQAGKQYTDRLVEFNEQRLRGLQQEVEQQRQQSLQVSTSLQQSRQQAVALSGDLRATTSQLEALNQRIRDLEALQVNPELILPSTPPPAESAPVPAPTEHDE